MMRPLDAFMQPAYRQQPKRQTEMNTMRSSKLPILATLILSIGLFSPTKLSAHWLRASSVEMTATRVTGFYDADFVGQLTAGINGLGERAVRRR